MKQEPCLLDTDIDSKTIQSVFLSTTGGPHTLWLTVLLSLLTSGALIAHPLKFSFLVPLFPCLCWSCLYLSDVVFFCSPSVVYQDQEAKVLSLRVLVQLQDIAVTWPSIIVLAHCPGYSLSLLAREKPVATGLQRVATLGHNPTQLSFKLVKGN